LQDKKRQKAKPLNMAFHLTPNRRCIKVPEDIQTIGIYAFIVGVILAIIAGLAGGAVAEYIGAITLILVILGLIVGFLNVKDKMVFNFLIAAIALMVVGSANLTTIDTIITPLGTILQAIINFITIFVAPAALVVALKAIYGLAKGPM
jgi:hypothetical protein